MAAFLLADVWPHWLACIIFIAAGATDYLDGILARRLNAVSDFGRMLDPIADKMLVLAAIALLLSKDAIPVLPSLIIICREVFVSGLREYLGQRAVQIPVIALGKWKTGIQFLALVLLFGSHTLSFSGELSSSVYLFGVVLIWLAAGLGVASAHSYWKTGFKTMFAQESQGT